MNAVIVVVVHVIANEPPQMLFVQRNNMVENLSAAASYPVWSENWIWLNSCWFVTAGTRLAIMI